jgi:hypothetical protein
LHLNAALSSEVRVPGAAMEGCGVVEVMRSLEWFAADGSFAGVAAMPTAELVELQALFNVPLSDPMCDCWPVGPVQAGRVSELAGVPLDLTRFAYFVSAHAATQQTPAETSLAADWRGI